MLRLYFAAKLIYINQYNHSQKGDKMKHSSVIAIVLVFAAVLSIGILGGGLTGNASGAASVLANSTVLSVGAALLAIGVLIVAGMQNAR